MQEIIEPDDHDSTYGDNEVRIIRYLRDRRWFYEANPGLG